MHRHLGGALRMTARTLPTLPLARRLTLSGWLMVGLVASPARAQVAAPTSVDGQVASISADIAALETIKRSIEVDNHRLIINKLEVDGRMVTGAVLIAPEQVESWFVTAISGGMTGAQAVTRARNIGELTRFYLNDIVILELASLRKRLETLRSQPVLPGNLPPAGGAGAAPAGASLRDGRGHGSWAVDCTWVQTPDPAAYRDGGAFSFSIDSVGAMRAQFLTTGKVYAIDYGASARLGWNGEILEGRGGGGGWSLLWDGALGLNENGIVGSGSVQLPYIDRWGRGSCSGRWWVP